MTLDPSIGLPIKLPMWQSSMLMAKGEECLDGWVRAGGGEVKGGGVDFGVTRSLLGKIHGENAEESGGEEFGVDGGVI
ncbi:hypothetical protein Tco_1162768 [Tanacetum coccineum]